MLRQSISFLLLWISFYQQNISNSIKRVKELRWWRVEWFREEVLSWLFSIRETSLSSSDIFSKVKGSVTLFHPFPGISLYKSKFRRFSSLQCTHASEWVLFPLLQEAVSRTTDSHSTLDLNTRDFFLLRNQRTKVQLLLSMRVLCSVIESKRVRQDERKRQIFDDQIESREILTSRSWEERQRELEFELIFSTSFFRYLQYFPFWLLFTCFILTSNPSFHLLQLAVKIEQWKTKLSFFLSKGEKNESE